MTGGVVLFDAGSAVGVISMTGIRTEAGNQAALAAVGRLLWAKACHPYFGRDLCKYPMLSQPDILPVANKQNPFEITGKIVDRGIGQVQQAGS